jgi:bifunctional UDP-N-acetylglucosamine pyrophosphorylase/glucosamine-1-phosphate N-acetyltransferase
VADFEEVAGVNTRVQLADAEAHARRRRNRELMLAGVTMRDPETTWVEADCQVAADVILGPGVVLRGRTRVAEGVEIDVGAVISDTEIGAGSRVLAYSHMEGAVIGRGVRVGPFARLRPGAVLRDEVRIGNFVEIKKSTIGVGSKANHLTYLGDATVGERVNVGAGTITCNYDGTHKHPTVLGDGVFVGSDTQFIAPVRVGERAYIAAGSTVTDDVPAGALAISRCRQTNKEGYTERRREREKKAKE